MSLISVYDLRVQLADPPLLEKASLQLEEGERVGLLGRNGSGKSTLMKLLAGEPLPFQGEISRKPGLRIAYLPQEVPQNLSGRVFDIINGGNQESDPIQNQFETDEEWKRHQQVERAISQLRLNPDVDISTLSAGWKRRVLLARGLARNPQVLLLDEPTNHLDIESIDWLEKYFAYFEGAILFVTHDRMFLRKLATRIIEIDRGNLLSWNCGYEPFLQRKEEALENEEIQRGKFDKKLAQEEAWLRRSPKARRTRNEGRVRALLQLREERRNWRDDPGNARLRIQKAEKSGDLVIEVKNLSFSYADREIIKDFSTVIMRGDKVGVIGPNGVGKTTLLKILLQELEPQQGKIRHGTKLEIAYFDQLRGQLNEDENVIENVGGGSDRIVVNGQPRHIFGYLKDFLFTPERAHSPVRILSGGERNRVLLAKLFTKPANVLVLDEPTNDLDAETLELMEELLVEYSGTVLLVSHDRAFLNNVVTNTLAMEGGGEVNEYVGGYDDWLRQRKQVQEETKEKRIQEREKNTDSNSQSKRIGYKEKRQLQMQYQELQEIPHKIERLEKEQADLNKQMSDPVFYKQSAAKILQAQDRQALIELELQETYQKWEELEEKFESIDEKEFS